ncbi:hypothetical protein CH92_04720 [Stutzerimonas stutzeri]|uniref:DUF2845 domain-containing protein n=1 Tax=Stutzerimonas stutzeri TaxID=316 RepID=W8RQV7_STUST|nr:DUF2845 domain-containing protein [Stutzerimonas stutzeri]AHL74426.1 hypothetical protein CH92_04720 [Stutzerimonas stutzeri]MCQ4328953.1 DUF2845 domain-containing protein [Stutzerimonas stutzeri]
MPTHTHRAWLLVFTLAAPLSQAETLRCGSQLISTGDRIFEVERKCGQPVQRDLIGHTLGSYARHELVIEEWVYGPNNGMFSILTFEGNRLIRIESRRDH